MNKKIAELRLTDIWEKDLVKALEKSGYVITLTFDGMTSRDYIISKPIEEKQE